MLGRCFSRGAVALVLLSSWAGTSASNASAGANATLSASRSGVQVSALRSWVGDLTIPIPANKTFSLPMNMGALTVAAGSHCTGLRVGNLVPKDNSSGEILEWDVSLSGVGISCHIQGENMGEVVIDITLASSSLQASVQIHPMHPEATPDLPLPLGYFNMTGCVPSINIKDFNTSGSSPLVSLINGIDKSMLLPLMGGFVNQPLCTAVEHLLQTNGTDALHQGAELAEGLLLPPEALPSPELLKPVLDWGTYPPIVVVQALLHERFSIWANRIMNVVDFSVLQVGLVKTENVSLTLSNIFVDGLITNQHMPGLSLTTTGSHGSTIDLFANLHGLALRSKLSLEVALPDQPVLRETFNVTLGLENLSLAVRAFAHKPTLDSLMLDAGRVLRSPACFLEATEGTTALHNESIAFESMDVFLKPVFNVHPEEGDLEMESTELINMVVGSLYANYFPSVSTLAHGALGMARAPLNEWLWRRFAELSCSDADLLLGLSSAASGGILGMAAILFAAGLLAAAFTWYRWGRKGASSGGDAAAGGDGSDRVSEANPAAAAAADAEVCLARQAFVPRALSVFYPFALVGVMLLFLYADLQLGATVSVVMASEGESTIIGQVFSFSLLSTVVHSWQSGAYVISLIAALSSGVWPLCKLSLLFATWLLPPRALSAKARGYILGFLNTWGKYSFVDCWFLVLTMSAFAIEWHSVGDASMKVRTTPTAAFYVFFVSTGLSLILGHVASECHTHGERLRHRVSEPVELAAAQAGPEEEGASDAATASPQEPRPPAALSTFATPRWARVPVACALGTTAALTLAGTFLVSFDFEIGGVFIEFLFGEEVTRQYSLLGVGMAVTEGRGYNAGLLGLEVVFLILAVVVPLVLLVALMVLWLMPMELKSQEGMLRVCYILDSWSSLDVAVLVLVTASFEFAKLAEFLVYKGDMAAPCRMVRDLTRSECMHMNLTSRPVIVVLLVAGLALLILPKITMRLCARAIFSEARSPVVQKQITQAALPQAMSKEGAANPDVQV